MVYQLQQEWRLLEKNKKPGNRYIMIRMENARGNNLGSLLIAGKHKLDNLIIIVDYNKLQALSKEGCILIENLSKFKAFNCNCFEIKMAIIFYQFTKFSKN